MKKYRIGYSIRNGILNPLNECMAVVNNFEIRMDFAGLMQAQGVNVNSDKNTALPKATKIDAIRGA